MVLEKTELTFFWIQSAILNIFGSHLVQERNTKWNRIRSLVNSFVFAPTMIPLGYTIWMSYPDITIMCSLMGIFTGFLSSSFKIPTLHFRVKHFVGIRTRVLKLYERVLPGEELYIVKIVNFVRKLALANGILLVVGSALLLTGPLMYAKVQIVRQMENVTWPTPYDAEYFVDMSKSGNYLAVNFWCLYNLLLCVIMNDCIDCIFFEACMFAAANFRVLQRRLERIDYHNENFNEKILDVIAYQREIYELAQEIQRAYCTILCPFFVIASIMSCAEFYSAQMVGENTKKKQIQWNNKSSTISSGGLEHHENGLRGLFVLLPVPDLLLHLRRPRDDPGEWSPEQCDFPLKVARGQAESAKAAANFDDAMSARVQDHGGILRRVHGDFLEGEWRKGIETVGS